MLERFAAQLVTWEGGQSSLSTLVTHLEVLRPEIPHDRFQRGAGPLLDDIEHVNASALFALRRQLTEEELARVEAAFASLRTLLDRARREIDDPCRDGQSCRS